MLPPIPVATAIAGAVIVLVGFALVYIPAAVVLLGLMVLAVAFFAIESESE